MTPTTYTVVRLSIIALFVGAGFIRWVFIKLQEQAAKKRALDDLERRRTDSLRTGRNLDEDGVPNPSAERARVEAEAAARRQAQIDEFRRRQQERARQRAEAQRGGPPQVQTSAAATARPIPSAPSRPVPQARPVPVRAAPAVAARPVEAPRQAPARPAHKSGPRQLLTPTGPEPETTHALVAHTESKATPAQAARAAMGRPQNAEQWRRAILMNAILSSPPGIGEGGDPWSPVS